MVAGLSLFTVVPSHSAMSYDPKCQSDKPSSGLLSSALSLLQGRFTAASMPGGGTAVARGKSFVLLVTSVMGDSYVIPGGGVMAVFAC